jgi:hypothetical protein
MIEELEALAKAIAGLPHLALYAMIGFLLYKLAVIGSVYGVIKMAIDRWHSWATHEKVITTVMNFKSVYVIFDDALEACLLSVCHRPGRSERKDTWLYSGDMQWLKEAIDEKKAREVKP